MNRKRVHAYLTAAIAVFLFIIGQGMAMVSHSPLATASPNPLANPHFATATSLLEQKDFQGAMRELNQAIQLDPSLATAYSFRGVLHLEAKNYQKATDDFTQVTRLEPKSADAHLNLAKSQLMLKDYQAALQSATKATQLEPQNQAAALLVKMIPHLAKPAQ
ncbi:tetratricopeptide repeat protein (plasmid) [Acaryochloris sp. 'Moss Beach']|uniref:tetratricopeptide repeat protein n=1 Tax=Acaryochloris sp. 'Moss Beach' TaxID=2740837 RepID=UPI001F47EDFA|nr:tetratricopeptide repeat protein [Acaryochloris sp. 'Moss Beach']UJB73145.1 tetratricopeptide repeat protein [Acaryochloris sp. 'Moss Beach']